MHNVGEECIRSIMLYYDKNFVLKTGSCQIVLFLPVLEYLREIFVLYPLNFFFSSNQHVTNKRENTNVINQIILPIHLLHMYFDTSKFIAQSFVYKHRKA